MRPKQLPDLSKIYVVLPMLNQGELSDRGVMMECYRKPIEDVMKKFYDSLSEKDRRRYAAVEVAKLGHGASVTSREFWVAIPKRSGRARATWNNRKILPGPSPSKRGGRKRLKNISPQLQQNFLDVLREHTAGDPMCEEIKWTNLTRREISMHLAERGRRPGNASSSN